MDIDIRTGKAFSREYLLKKIKKLAGGVSKKFSLEVLTFQKPALASKENLLSKTLKASLRKSGLRPKMKVSRGATVLNFLTERKIPALVFGFSSKSQAHRADEYIETANLEKGAKVLKDFLIGLDEKNE